MSYWQDKIDVLLDEATLQTRIRELGVQLTRDYAGREITAIGILKGSFAFYADLVRAIDLPVRCEFIGISSYGDHTQSSGVVKFTSDLMESIENQDVLIIEDIVDTGLTMRYLLDNFATRRPRSLKVCALLHKPANAQAQVPLDYVGFTIENHFVIGYGLDLASRYRNLPFVGVYRGG